MPKVSVVLFIEGDASESFIADIPEDKLFQVRAEFIDEIAEFIYKYEKDDIEIEEN